MRVLGIESSCDETGIAIYDSEQGLLAHALHSQISMHAEFGGVVPELASRDHVRKITPLVQEVMRMANSTAADIDGIAYTKGPGLVGALLVGAMFARSLAWAWKRPCVGVHHMEGHLLAPMLEASPPKFPFIALLVSGGHTQLIKVTALGEYVLLGDTLDDATGEAFDKTAKMLGLAYPGGPKIAALAEQGDPKRYRFPRPMTDRPGMDFSFSGLKTYALNTWLDSEQDEHAKADIARAFQDAVVETLAIKCRRAIEATGINRIVIAGGVGANTALRAALATMVEKYQGEIAYPRIEFCTDNGAMIAYTGCQHLLNGMHDDLSIDVKARWPLAEL